MKEYKFSGLDKWANIKGGIIMALVIITIVGIGFYFFHDKLKTYFTAVFFITSHAFIAITIYLTFIAKYIQNQWKINITEDYIELFFNNKYVNKIFFTEIRNIQIAGRKIDRRYMKIINAQGKKK